MTCHHVTCKSLLSFFLSSREKTRHNAHDRIQFVRRGAGDQRGDIIATKSRKKERKKERKEKERYELILKGDQSLSEQGGNR